MKITGKSLFGYPTITSKWYKLITSTQGGGGDMYELVKRGKGALYSTNGHIAMKIETTPNEIDFGENVYSQVSDAYYLSKDRMLIPVQSESVRKMDYRTLLDPTLFTRSALVECFLMNPLVAMAHTLKEFNVVPDLDIIADTLEYLTVLTPDYVRVYADGQPSIAATTLMLECTFGSGEATRKVSILLPVSGEEVEYLKVEETNLFNQRRKVG